MEVGSLLYMVGHTDLPRTYRWPPYTFRKLDHTVQTSIKARCLQMRRSSRYKNPT